MEGDVDRHIGKRSLVCMGHCAKGNKIQEMMSVTTI